MYSPLPTTVTNRPLGKWGKDVANVSMEPVSLVRKETAAHVNEVDGEEEIVSREDIVVAGID